MIKWNNKICIYFNFNHYWPLVKKQHVVGRVVAGGCSPDDECMRFRVDEERELARGGVHTPVWSQAPVFLWEESVRSQRGVSDSSKWNIQHRQGRRHILRHTNNAVIRFTFKLLAIFCHKQSLLLDSFLNVFCCF